MPNVTIFLLGLPRIEVQGVPLVIERRKAVALAAYLAASGGLHSRDELATLLWPELSQERARAALRGTLPDLVARVSTAWIVADRKAIGVRPEAAWTDVVAFGELLARVRAHHENDSPLCERCVGVLREAEALYRADFLQGFALPDCPDFEAWQLARRETARRGLAWALQSLAAYKGQRGAAGRLAALEAARRWLDLDPLHEPAHRLLMRLYAAAGMRSEALRQYRACAELLESELRVGPASETIALYEQIRSARELGHAAEPAVLSPPRQLPASRGRFLPEPGSFVGRQAELALLVELLAEPDCRLISLVGPGGIGKTRLASRVLTMLAGRFADGAWLVQLGEASAPGQVIAQIAHTLGIPLAARSDARQTLLDALAQRRLLLVLDNFEQLLQTAWLLLELLGAAPGLKLLVTSRERLAVRAEHVVPLNGLPCPSDHEAEIGGYGAVELFVQRARQVRPEFALSAANRAAIVRICAAVEGLPLGIELAAAWVRSLSVDEIAAEIVRSPDFLRSSLRDLPERHRSLRAVFDHSWQLLSAAERATLRQLAVFRGGFSAEAAQAVVGASVYDLAALEDKSLLRRSADQRYGLHPLVQQYAAEQLSETEGEAGLLRARHARFFAAFVQRHEPALRGADQRAALAAMSQDGPNIRQAWAWSRRTGDLTSLEDLLEGLAIFCELRGYRHEADANLAEMEEALAGGAQSDTRRARLLGRVLAWRGRFVQLLGHQEQAEEILARGLTLAQTHADTSTIAFCLVSQGMNANTRGEHVRARLLHRASLERYEAIDDRSGMAEVLNRLGGNAYDQGDLDEARRCWQTSVALYRALGDVSGLARGLSNLGEVERLRGDFAASQQFALDSLAMLEQVGRGWQTLYAKLNLGLLALYAGRTAEARTLNAECLALAGRVGDERGVANAILRQGDVALQLGALAEAERLYLESLQLFRAMQRRQGIATCLVGLAEVALRRGYAHEAVRLGREALELARASAARLGEATALGLLGLALSQIDKAAGLAALHEARAIFEQTGARPDELEARVRLATLLLCPDLDALRDPQEAERLLAGVTDDPACWASTRARVAELRAALR